MAAAEAAAGLLIETMACNAEEVRQWFERAAGVPHASRRALLQSSCPDGEIRSEVLSLLEYDGESDDLSHAVSRAIRHLATPDQPREPDLAPVKRVGPFELTGVLGSGGMGLVYQARRADGAVDQNVAVKFAHVPPGSSAALRSAVHRRFFRERQTLASLRHPYIAGLIDAGEVAGGTPYAVIEQVDGVPIDRYCDASLPDVDGRLKLFLKLCDAVQFAHRNLIVHGDIKPENVLVTADGIPKLIDFGVACSFAGGATPTHSRAFTPEYASPEQLLGAKATVLTDVYGLGAVLFRVLTGATPRESGDGSLSDLVRSAQEELVRPSAIRPQLKGDLENILVKALHCDPQRRYGSVPELADDVRRFLDQRPVRATPDSALYRARRFVKRHWGTVAVAGVLAVALAATAILATVERQRALRSAAESRRLASRLIFDIHDSLSGVVGGTRARERLSATALQYLSSIEENHGDDPEIAWELFNAHARLASSRGGGSSSVGDVEAATRSAARALQIGSGFEHPSQRGRFSNLFDVYESLASIFHEAGQPHQQRAVIDRMLRLARSLDRARQAQSLVLLARYLEDYGIDSDAARAYGDALAILRALTDGSNGPSLAEGKLISTLVGYGRALALGGEFTSALASLNEAVERSQRQMAAHPGIRSARQAYWSHLSLGDVLGNPGRFSLEKLPEAVVHYRTARDIAQRLVNADPANEVTRMDLARALNREAFAIAGAERTRALALFDRYRQLMSQTGVNGRSAADARLTYLTGSVVPLLHLGEFERVDKQIAEARSRFAEMLKMGMKPKSNPLLRAEALLTLHRDGRKQAIALALTRLAAMPADINPALSGNYDRIELLELVRTWSAGYDEQACASAGRQLAELWHQLAAHRPASAFVREQAQRARALASRSCSAPMDGRSAVTRPPRVAAARLRSR